jgi:CBS domain-containing protein
MLVKDVMTNGGAEWTFATMPLDKAAEQMKDLNVGSLPVCDSDRLVGMITDRDITVRATSLSLDPATTTVAEVMTPVIYSCYEDQDIEEAAALMRQKQIRRLPVLDRNRRLVGIVSLGDLAVRGRDDALSGNTLEKISEPPESQR